MQNANRLTVKPFISTDLFLLFRQCEIWTHDYLVWGRRHTNWATKQITNALNQKLYLSYYCYLYTNTKHTSRIIRTFNLRVGVIGSLVSWIAMLPHDPESWVRVSLNKVITHKISHCILIIVCCIVVEMKYEGCSGRWEWKEERGERERESGWGRTRGKNFYLKNKNNATALECSMQLHWNVLCNCIGTFNAIS